MIQRVSLKGARLHALSEERSVPTDSNGMEKYAQMDKQKVQAKVSYDGKLSGSMNPMPTWASCCRCDGKVS